MFSFREHARTTVLTYNLACVQCYTCVIVVVQCANNAARSIHLVLQSMIFKGSGRGLVVKVLDSGL